MAKVLGIFGAGGLAREVLEVARSINETCDKWNEIVFVDVEPLEERINSIRVISENDAFSMSGDIEAVVAVGEPLLREKIYSLLVGKKMKLVSLIHPTVRIPTSTIIGKGTIICSNALVSCNINIDDNVYIQPHAVIGHDTVIGKHSTVGAGSVVGGNNRIGNRVFLGLLCGTIQGLTIMDDAEISAGAIVFRNVESGMIVMGNPARVIRKNDGQGVFKPKGEQ